MPAANFRARAGYRTFVYAKPASDGAGFDRRSVVARSTYLNVLGNRADEHGVAEDPAYRVFDQATGEPLGRLTLVRDEARRVLNWQLA
jgi:hypothetical protein